MEDLDASRWRLILNRETLNSMAADGDRNTLSKSNLFTVKDNVSLGIQPSNRRVLDE